MLLEQLGWNDYFQALFSVHSGTGADPARAMAASRGLHEVATRQGCLTASVAGRALRDGLSPVTGDWVVLRDKRIEAVLERRTAFVRQQAGRSTGDQVVAANVDVAFLVMGLDRDFNPRRLERYLVAVWDSGARPVVVLNKADLLPDPGPALDEAERLAAADVLAVSALDGAGVEQLDARVRPGETAVLLGSSGVGKSTLANRLLGRDTLPTAAVRTSDGRGRHTTTRRELMLLPQGWLLMDTPGMRELQLSATDDALDRAFDDIETLAADCRFRDCTHSSEPGCAVRAAIEAGDLDANRLAGYDKLRRELLHHASRVDTREALNRKAREKSLHRMIRRLPHH